MSEMPQPLCGLISPEDHPMGEGDTRGGGFTAGVGQATGLVDAQGAGPL